MKNLKIVLSIILLVFISTSSFCQETTSVLVMTNKNTGREIRLNEKTKITVRTKDGNIYKGRFLIQEESFNFYESNELVEIKDVDVIKYKTRLGRIVSTSLVAIPSLLAVGNGIAGLTSTGWDSLGYYGAAIMSAGVAIILSPFAIIKIRITRKKYKFSIEKSVKKYI